MYCTNCGNEMNKEDKFCPKCGTPIKEEPVASLSTSPVPKFNSSPKENRNESNLATNQKERTLDITSKILGFVALIFSFLVLIISIPLSLGSMVLGFLYQKRTNKKSIGLLLGIVALIISIIFFIVNLVTLFNPVHAVVGTWNCSSSATSTNYIVTFDLRKNKTFTWSKYNDGANNYVKGTYTFEDLKKKNNSGEFLYYAITLSGDEFIENGKQQSEKYTASYEMGVASPLSSTDGHAVLMNTSTYNTYYCTLKK